MKRRANTAAEIRPEDWRRTNPEYQSGGVRRVRIRGVDCVEFDAGKWWDYTRDQRAMSKGRRHG